MYGGITQSLSKIDPLLDINCWIQKNLTKAQYSLQKITSMEATHPRTYYSENILNQKTNEAATKAQNSRSS